MRKCSTIVLLSLLLISLLWNGVSLVHYLVEHTHSFCATELDHQHASTDDCHSICLVTSENNQTQIPAKGLAFFEIKQCITAFPFFNSQFVFTNTTSTISDAILIAGRLHSVSIFRPPIA